MSIITVSRVQKVFHNTGLKVKIAQTSSPMSLCQIKFTIRSLQWETKCASSERMGEKSTGELRRQSRPIEYFGISEKRHYKF